MGSFPETYDPCDLPQANIMGRDPAAREKKKPWPRVTYMYIYALNGESYWTA